jgi:hypothetical protein
MQNSEIEEAQFRQYPSARLLFLPVRWSAIISVVHWAAEQWTKIAVTPPLLNLIGQEISSCDLSTNCAKPAQESVMNACGNYLFHDVVHQT